MPTLASLHRARTLLATSASLLGVAALVRCTPFGDAGTGTSPDDGGAEASVSQAADARVVDAGADAVVVAASYRDVILRDGPIAYWRLGESAGLTAKDELGGNDGTYNDMDVRLGEPGAIAGDPDTAAVFTGTVSTVSGHVRTNATLGNFATLAPHSIEGWVRLDNVPPNAYPMIWSKISDEDGEAAAGYWCGFDKGHATLRCARFATKALQARVEVTSFPVGRFTHVVSTFDGEVLRLYLDGDMRAEKAAAIAIPATTEALVLAGNAIGGEGLPGALDEVALYNRALTPAEIGAHFKAGRGP